MLLQIHVLFVFDSVLIFAWYHSVLFFEEPELELNPFTSGKYL
jgi:hypothetical protein